jgi:Type I phosphodiesterase / nucleotide pyrophosphatase
MNPSKVLLVELNEVTWTVIDRLVAQRGAGFLPNFARLRRDGAWATQVAVERAPHLDPWITWMTLHTGVPREQHGASVLEQHADTIRAQRLWDRVVDAGRKVGVFGSIGAYPPRAVDGFIVPGPFAPSDDTHPPSLRAVQGLNRLGTHLHNRTAGPAAARQMIAKAFELLRLGLRPATIVRIAAQLLRERLQPHQRWRRATLQPRINYDFFSALYRRHRPDFATWHSNHAAHFMHHYWRAWDDSQFTAKATAAERRHYAQAVPHGYRLCDELLGRFMRLLDDNTVLVVASSMGQQPYASERYRDGKVVVRLRDIDALLDLLGRDGIDEAVPTMVPQWNLRIGDAKRRAEVKALIEAAYRVIDGRRQPAMAVAQTDGMLTITPLGLAAAPRGVRCYFPGTTGHGEHGLGFDELFAADAPTVKQGMHHPNGLLGFYGAGIRRGVEMAPCTNLDVAPTLLRILGLPVPRSMRGRILAEAWSC